MVLEIAIYLHLSQLKPRLTCGYLARLKGLEPLTF
jgi:hypothetical protein